MRNSSNGTSRLRAPERNLRRARRWGFAELLRGRHDRLDGLLSSHLRAGRFQSGIGNLNTESVDVHRARCWRGPGCSVGGCDITWGDTAKNLPFVSLVGSRRTR
jgi:hypothetical protein